MHDVFLALKEMSTIQKHVPEQGKHFISFLSSICSAMTLNIPCAKHALLNVTKVISKKIVTAVTTQ